MREQNARCGRGRPVPRVQDKVRLEVACDSSFNYVPSGADPRKMSCSSIFETGPTLSQAEVERLDSLMRDEWKKAYNYGHSQP
eukprot:8267308-Pyramimonas_sp.AAC.1